MTSRLNKIIRDLSKKNPTLVGDIVNSATTRKVKIDSPQLSFLFGGGIPIGRMIRFRGPESSGKSIISCYCAAQLQKKLPAFLGAPEKSVIVYVDFERTFEAKFASQVGVDTGQGSFVHLLPDDIETASDTLAEMIKTNEVACVIFDSDAAAPTRAMFVDPSGKSNFGSGAKALAEMLKKVNILCANYNTTLFWISQERVSMDAYAKLPTVTGGEAPKFYSSVVNRVTKTDVIKEGNETAGISIRVRNYKNKAGVPFRDANMNLYYNGGFRPDEEYIDFLASFGIVKQKGAYFYVEGEDKGLQGRVRLQEWLDSHPEEYERMKGRVDEMLVSENIFDEKKEMVSEGVNIGTLKSYDVIDEEIGDDILEEN